MRINRREIKKGICSCGGSVNSVEATQEELKKHNCHSKWECCMAVIECEKCKTRIIFELEAPEM